MVPTPDPTAPRPPVPGAVAELPAKGADLVESLVTLLRDRTVRPLTLATRAVVFGLIVLVAGLVTLTLLSIAVVRLLTVYAFDGRVWLSDVVVGAVFVLLGMFAWSKRGSTSSAPSGGRS